MGSFCFPYDGNGEKEKRRYFSTVFSEPMRYLSLSIFSIIAAPNCYRPVGQNTSPQVVNLLHPRRVMNLTPAAQPVGGSLGAYRCEGHRPRIPERTPFPKVPRNQRRGSRGRNLLPRVGVQGAKPPGALSPAFSRESRPRHGQWPPRRRRLPHPLPMVGKSPPWSPAPRFAQRGRPNVLRRVQRRPPYNFAH